MAILKYNLGGRPIFVGNSKIVFIGPGVTHYPVWSSGLVIRAVKFQMPFSLPVDRAFLVPVEGQVTSTLAEEVFSPRKSFPHPMSIGLLGACVSKPTL